MRWQAMNVAHEEPRYNAILKSTAAIMFFGTPHRGGANGVATAGAAVAKAMNVLSSVTLTGGATGTARSDLLRQLKPLSPEWEAISRSFVHKTKDMDIVSVYETKSLAPLDSLVRKRFWLMLLLSSSPNLTEQIVERPSAVMGVSDEQAVPLNANHQELCRFAHARSESYIKIAPIIARLATQAVNTGTAGIAGNADRSVGML